MTDPIDNEENDAALPDADLPQDEEEDPKNDEAPEEGEEA